MTTLTAAILAAETDLFSPIINSVSPGIAVLIVFVVAMTLVVVEIRSLKSRLERTATKDDMLLAILQLRRELDREYDQRFLHRPDYRPNDDGSWRRGFDPAIGGAVARP